MSASVHAFRVSYQHGGYRSFSHFDTWNAYLLALESLGHRWLLSADGTTAFVELAA
jgi:hypothetical protein